MENTKKIQLFDSHAHYFDRRFEEVGGADAILRSEVFGGDVSRVINVGTNNKNNLICIEQTGLWEGMYAAVGIHPEDARYCEGSVAEEVARLADIIGDKESRAAKKIVAIGEIGLDYHYEGFDKARQAEFFDAQMELAEMLDMPVIIHDREAHGDCFETVLRHPRVRGVFHSYSGSTEMAAELVRRGWYISFSGVVTFKNASRVKDVAASIPLDRLLIETDAPYLAPHPYRGKMNHSGLMIHTAHTLAIIKEISTEELAAHTYDNACRLFGIK